MILMTFMVIVAIVLSTLGITAIVANRDSRIKSLKEKNDELRALASHRGESLVEAHRALRAIANNAGNPVLEAQLALDNYNRKEIL